MCIVPVYAGLLSQSLLFELAGSVFFTGFVVAAVAFTVEATSWPNRVFGLAACALAVVVLGSFGWIVTYPVLVCLAGAVSVGRSANTASR